MIVRLLRELYPLNIFCIANKADFWGVIGCCACGVQSDPACLQDRISDLEPGGGFFVFLVCGFPWYLPRSSEQSPNFNQPTQPPKNALLSPPVPPFAVAPCARLPLFGTAIAEVASSSAVPIPGLRAIHPVN